MSPFTPNPYRPWGFLLNQENNWTAIQTFQKGINLTGLLSPPSVVNGHIFHYDKRFYIDSANRRIISRSSDAITAPVTVSNTADETLLWEGGVSADTLAIGESLSSLYFWKVLNY